MIKLICKRFSVGPMKSERRKSRKHARRRKRALRQRRKRPNDVLDRKQKNWNVVKKSCVVRKRSNVRRS